MNEWIAAAIAVGAGLVIGAVARSVVQRTLGAERRPEAVRSSAGALGGLAFSLAVVLGLVSALGAIDPDSLADLPENVVAFVPRAIAAAVLLIGGNIAASFATIAVGRALTGAPAATQRRAVAAARLAILGAAALLAAGQLGVNTTILNLAAAAVFFSIGATFTLLSGLGGRHVSAELAAGRAVRRMIAPGDHLTTEAGAGVVGRLHPSAVELVLDDGELLLVPNSWLLDRPTTLRRGD